MEQEMRELVDSLLQNGDPAEDAVLMEDTYQAQSARPVVIPAAELSLKIRSLNEKQREIFDLAHICEKRCVKNLS